MFISVPIILAIEMLFATWSWQKPWKSDPTPPLCEARRGALFFVFHFIGSHLMWHIWADANFYRPDTMQRVNLPLSIR